MTISPPAESELALALDAAREHPSDSTTWDALEAAADRAQAPEPVADLYVEVLSAAHQSSATLRRLRERALRFGEQWFGDEAPQMQALLIKAFELDPRDDVLFERLVVSLTSAGAWTALLDVHERALSASDSLERRADLLDEAVKIARDLAHDEGRALALLRMLITLRPEDPSLRGQLERLLERSGRFQELVLSLSATDVPRSESRADALSRAAGFWLRELKSAPRALELVREVLAAEPRHPAALAVAEAVFASEDAASGTRRGALELLTEVYAQHDLQRERARLLEAGLSLYEGKDRVRVQRELARLLSASERGSEAVEQLARALAAAPHDDELLLELGDLSARFKLEAVYARALSSAAQATEPSAQREQLRLLEAKVRREALDETEAAIALYQSVLAQDHAREAAVEAGQALDGLFDAANRREERMAVLGRLAELEPLPAIRRELLGAMAQTALELGDHERALSAFRQRLTLDAADREALDGAIAIYEARGEHQALIALLAQRAELVGGEPGARDHARIGQLYALELHQLEPALQAFSTLHREAPELLEELAVGDLLDRAGAREVTESARLATALGDAYRALLGDAERALEHYARALSNEPGLATARAGLEALLEIEAVRARAADVLASAYATTDDVAALVALLPHRLAVATSAAERGRLLRQAAQLEATRRGAPERAFARACESLIEDPTDSTGDVELWRLAEQLDGFPELVEALHDAALALDPTHPRCGQLRVSEAQLSELRLNDLPRALAAYQAAQRALPGDAGVAEAICRVAAALSRFREAFDVVVAMADRLDQLPDALLEMLEEHAGEHGVFRALADAARESFVGARLTGPTRRALMLRVADWYERHVGDHAAAEALLSEASKLGGPHAETLRRLAALQRRAPGRALFDTLLAAAELNDVELALLWEAAELARNELRDDARERDVLERLVARSANLLRHGQRGADGSSPEEVLISATSRLADKLSQTGEALAELALLREAANQPIVEEHARIFAERAALLALRTLGDSDLAISLYQRALELAPNDPALLAALSSEYDRRGKLDDLVVLRRRELAATMSAPRRLELRLELARVLGELEARGGRLAALRENLQESPGHRASIQAVEGILRQQGALSEVYALLAEQALQLEAVGELTHAAELWRRAAELADTDLRDEERALNAYQKLAGLEHDERALAALARIRLERNEPGLAVPWIERSLASRPEADREPLRMRLARAHQAAGNEEAAMRALESGLEEAPDSLALRDLLSELYERNGRYRQLAELLADGTTRTRDPAVLLAYARRAALLFREPLGTPERSVDVLRRAVEAHPDDRSLELEYVDALIMAGRLDDAKRVLDEMVLAYGRRRSPERAELHLRLSHVAHARDEVDEALTQLDTAASMDRSHPGILRSLGELALAAGQLERAERAYRTLLLILRRPGAASGAPEVGTSEVLYQLHRIAAGLAQHDKAAELLESAVQTAVHSESETARLKSLLLERGEPELLLRVLELRLAQVASAETEAEVLSDLADVLETTLDRKEEALEARLKALICAPELDELHAATLRVAKELGRERRYVEALSNLTERARRKDDLAQVSELALRAGSLCEHELGDSETAATFYGQVSRAHNGFVEAQFALARVCGRLGREDDERAVLERIAALPDEPTYMDAKRGALYRLIELQVQQSETREAGLLSLGKLVEEQPDYARAAHILSLVHQHAEDDLTALSMFEQMARRSGDPRLLLDALERRGRSVHATPELLREGAELALSLGETERGEQLLRRAIEVAEAGEGLAHSAWAPVLLARSLKERGDAEGALDWFERALELAGPDESFELGLELAQLAASHDRARAVRAYEQLRRRDPADRRVWGPLLTFYADAGELETLLEIVQATLDTLASQADRNALRIETAQLMARAEREDKAADLLQDVLAEDPDHADAALRLADLYERRGEQEKLVELLARKLESARERRSPSVIPLSLRMGSMLAQTQPNEARSLYREALGLMPANDELLRAAIDQSTGEEQAEERAELIVRYLGLPGASELAAARGYASWLVDYRAEQLEPSGFEQALELAYRIAPEQAGLRSRLLAWHREHNNHARLAELLESDSRRESDPTRAIALLTEAVELRTLLGQASEAAALLRHARELAPDDLALLKRAVHASAASGEFGPAIAEIDGSLAHSERSGAERTELLLLRAEIAGLAGLHDEALASLTEAHAVGGEAVEDALIRGVERARLAARDSGQRTRERELSLRLANLYNERGQSDLAIEVLEDWLSRADNDLQAMRVALELTAHAERWGAVLGLAEALCGLDELHVLGHLGERLLEAARGLGRPELARAGLERAYERDPGQERLAELLEELYREVDDRRALTRLLSARIPGESDPERRFEQLRRVAELALEVGEADLALAHLEEALALRGDDLPTVLLLADAKLALGRVGEARELIERTMSTVRQRRSPELAQLRLRMARLSQAEDDPQVRFDWLASALDADMNNGEVASELAIVAQELGQLDVALKALRAVTMMKGDAPMSRAEAFFRQAIIVAQKGEPRRAVLWAKKAKAEDQQFPGVDRLIAELESAG